MKVSEGFSMADSRNLPKVDYMMFLEYMRGNDTFNVAVLFVCLRLHTIEPWSIWVHKRNVYSDTLEQCFYTSITPMEELKEEPNLSEKQTSDYFTSYEDLEVHQTMLEDEPRTDAYRQAILNNKSYFKDKVVIDVGCGTGILSIFCAQAGAKKVYAVEASNLAQLAKEIVKENGFEDVIEVIHSRVEDLILPDTKVDAIVSEWMGFYLLHEGMLDSVLVARDRFLKENGLIFPETAVIYVSPCSVPQLYDKWTNFNGVKMTSFAKHLRSNKCSKPEILNIDPEDLLGNGEIISWINLKEDKVSELDSFSLQHVIGSNKSGKYQGLCIWFECIFPDLSSAGGEGDRVILNTSPRHAPTHWKQTVIVLPDEQTVEEREPIAFKLDMKRDAENSRRYNLQMEMLDPNVIDHPQPCSCDMTKCILINAFLSQHTERALGANEDGLVEEDINDNDEKLTFTSDSDSC